MARSGASAFQRGPDADGLALRSFGDGASVREARPACVKSKNALLLESDEDALSDEPNPELC